MPDSKANLSIDFDLNRRDYHRKIGGKDPFLKAIGKKIAGKKVLDLTAGLGRDAVFLAQQGFDVIALERNSEIYSYLDQAKKNCMRTDLQKLNFIFFDALDFLRKENLSDICCAYYDPIFADVDKKTKNEHRKAKSRKEIVELKEIVGADYDTAEVLQALLKSGIPRIVVKRALRANILAEIKPRQSILGKSVRFDLYFF